jgi:hypothetical protein
MEFTLKELVNFIEASGFHVEAAEELPEEDPGVLESLDGPPIRAVRLTITPGEKPSAPRAPKGRKTADRRVLQKGS